MNLEKIIDLQNISVIYDYAKALDNISLKISNKQHTAILGANGSGKSTLIKLISNDVYPVFNQNSVKKIFSEDSWDIWELKTKLGFITNDLHFNLQNNAKNITTYEVIKSSFFSSIGFFPHQKYTDEQHIKTKQIIQYLDIENLAVKTVSSLSTGELRKIVIARALVHEPQALLLDEPTVGLDIKSQIDFVNLINTLSKTKTIILITHSVEEIFSSIKQVVLMKDGAIWQQGKKDNLMTSKNLSYIFDTQITLHQKQHRYSIAVNA